MLPKPAPVSFRVFASQPVNHPLPGVVAQVLERPRRLSRAEVGAPAAQDRVEPVEQLVERLVGAAFGDLLDLVQDRPQGRSAWEQEDAGAASTSQVALDAPPEEAEPLVAQTRLWRSLNLRA